MSSTTSNYGWGALVATMGMLTVSPDMLLIRLGQIQQPEMACVLFTKYAFNSVTILIAMSVRFGGPRAFIADCRQTGWHFYASGISVGLFEFCFNLGGLHTSAANALLLFYLMPVWCIFLSYVVFNEKPARHTIVAVILAVGFLVLIFIGSRDEALERRHSFFGDMVSLLGGFLWALHLTFARDAAMKYPDADMVGSTALGSVVIFFLSSCMAKFHVDTVCRPISGIWGYRWVFIDGVFVLPIGISLLALAPKYCPSSIVGLIAPGEAVLAPAWVWLVLGERPPLTTLIGGAGLVLTLTVHATVDAVKEAQTSEAMTEQTRLLPPELQTEKLA